MKPNQILFIALIAVSSALLCSADDAQSNDVPANRRSSLALPRIFDFERFKSAFREKYASIIEELARKKIFLSRAFRAFLSLFSTSIMRAIHT